MTEIFTIGHSNHDMDEFLRILKKNAIAVVVDVRSEPHSRYAPQFNKASLERSLGSAGISYRYSGGSLGGRPKDPSLQTSDGKPDYARIAATEGFRAELEAVLALAQGGRVCLMCSEADPMCCHRESVVGKELRARGARVVHIDPDGRTSGVSN